MKKAFFVFSFVIIQLIGRSQDQVSISTGTDFYISPSTVFTTNGLSLIPDAGFIINGVTINQATTTSHFTANNYLSKVFKFSNNSNPFTGTIRFQYNDGELNGLTETGLRVTINDGSSWLSYSTASFDATNNFVVSTSLSGRVLNEIILSDAFSILPLKWGPVHAWRQEQKINIEWNTKQENSVSRFDIERSENGQGWSSVITNIPARNSGTDEKYSAIDNSFNSARLYYRVSQTDIDGKFTFSPIAAAPAVNETSTLLVYPNPVMQKFYIGNINTGNIRLVELYNNNGALVKTWAGQQTTYPVNDLPAGIYHLKVQLKDGINKFFKLNKQQSSQ